MTLIVFSVDVERDSSHSIKGKPLCATTFGESEPCFSATEAGLNDLLFLLDSLEIPATFFFEAQTAVVLKEKTDLKKDFAKHEIGFHGFNHEDFAGLKTGVKIGRKKREEILIEGKKVLQNVFSRKEFGFRVPYMSIDDELLDIASGLFSYDSSFYGNKIIAHNGFCRIPVFEGTDSKGKQIKGFLWPLMEEERPLTDYLRLVEYGIKNNVNPIVLGTHSWHTRITRKNGRLSEKQAEKNTAAVSKLLAEIKKLDGAEFSTLAKAKKAFWKA